MEMSISSPVQRAIEHLASQLSPVGTTRVPIEQALGRILIEDLLADRDSPALAVSAMDGYAVRIEDVGCADLPIQATAAAGSAPLELLAGHAIRIFTGAAVPAGANCVVRREDTHESATVVRIDVPPESLHSGLCIRARGENSRRGATILPSGTLVNAATVVALASFGAGEVAVRPRVRVAILNTGDELAKPGEAVADWQIRDSNGPTLEACLAGLPWVEIVQRRHVSDRLAAVEEALESELNRCDAVLLTGGVSMGDTDFVPRAIANLGGEIHFHRLPIRPGKPVLGAALDGKLLLGLPGNPVSVAVTARVFGLPLLRTLGGCSSGVPQPLVSLAEADDKCLDLIWYRLVEIDAEGQVRLLVSRGSGDVVSLSQSHGFVEVPVGASGSGPFRLTLW